MANLKVKIVIRTTGPDGRRGWVPATGTNDPAGPLYLRWYEGSTPRHQVVNGSFEVAEMAKMRLEKKLKAASQGFIVPDEPATAKATRHWRTALDTYINHLIGKTKRNGWKYDARSIRAREKNVCEFAQLAVYKPSSLHVSEPSREDFEMVQGSWRVGCQGPKSQESNFLSFSSRNQNSRQAVLDVDLAASRCFTISLAPNIGQAS